ncbi:anti-sigma-G factor Gin [Paraliobacillus ryukyuensis]|uniref:Inhibitor of sigma-G Gin protein n=1 Tax=Paraliobacillus ryukyuensis TaxID=200904 RepID=A0A366DT26_9BACI|nr:sigma factor G inhibitor Gin [Paraliobacillus ryukyuensis]RBO92358.1 inhibitor of sigma-G Gin protein [Paraliobacillus ryukyuensis]
MEEIEKLETCDVCHKGQKAGIHLYHLFICESCEQKIIKTNPEDPSYAYFVNKLKQLKKRKQYS